MFLIFSPKSLQTGEDQCDTLKVSLKDIWPIDAFKVDKYVCFLNDIWSRRTF